MVLSSKESIKDETKHWQQYHDQWMSRDTIPANPRIIKAIVNTLKDINGKRILEVGSGTGRDSIFLAKMGAECFLLDYVEAPLKTARNIAEKENIKIQTVQADANNIPFESNYFDLVYSQGFFEHFSEPAALLKEQIRVLKKNGYLLIDVPQKYHIYTLIKHSLMLIKKWIPGWETEFTINELKKMVEDNGLKITSTYGDWSHPPMLWKLISSILRMPIKPYIYKPENNKKISKLRTSRFTYYTFQHIGVIGKNINGEITENAPQINSNR